jgi:hypothetical protein
MILRCFTKRIKLGEFRFKVFRCFGRGSTWGCEEGGPTLCFWGNLCHLKGFCELLVYYGMT